MSNLTVIIGTACIAGGLLWRYLAARGEAQRLVTALHANNPGDRIAAVRDAGTKGLDRCASALNDLVATEQDPAVLDAVAETVALRQWEPADREAVVVLRAWAADRLIERGGAVRRFGPAVTRLADMGGPKREFAGDDGITGDRTLDATIAELRALCARVGADQASFTVGTTVVAFDRQDDVEVVADVAARVADNAGAHGQLGGYDIRINSR